MEIKTILTVLTGSRAYGYARPDSDYDYRSIVVAPTSVVLDPFRQHELRTTQQLGVEADNTQYEIGHFIRLMASGNPTIIECLYAPVRHSTPEGDMLRTHLREMIPYPVCVQSFLGYAEGARHKIISDAPRVIKHATAYLRIAHQLSDLLSDCAGLRFPLGPEALKQCTTLREGRMSVEDAINHARAVMWNAVEDRKNETGCALLRAFLCAAPVRALVSREWEERDQPFFQQRLTKFLLDIRKNNW